MNLSDPDDIETLATATRQLLLEDPVARRIAIPFLHVRNAHPASLATYEDLSSGRISRFALPKTKLLSLARLMLAFARREKLFFGDALPEKADVLFLSHFLNGRQAASKDDNYFGTLPQELAKSGLGSVVACINHTWLREKEISAQWRSSAIPRAVLGRMVGLTGEQWIARELRRSARELAVAAARPGLEGEIARHAALHADTNSSATALRIAMQVTELVRRLKPRYLVSTFEGHPWERLAWHAARTVEPRILCVGYHHTVMFPHAFALAARLGANFDPDAILTAGEITASWFSRQPAWQDTPVGALGSVRAPNRPSGHIAPSTATGCLVVPEGILDEALRLFRLAIATAPSLPDQIFRLRLHPVLDKATFLKAAPDLHSLPPNVIWSDQSLEAELAESRTVLYRGSTVVLTAVLSGLRPVYVAWPGEQISIDPLRDLVDWRVTVNSPESLREEVRKDMQASEAVRRAEFNKAHDYCSRYFTPFTPKAFEALTGGL